MIFDKRPPEQLAARMIHLWSRLSKGVSIILADNTTTLSEDPSTGHGEIHAAMALTAALSFRGIRWSAYFSYQLERDPALLPALLENGHLICLGGPDTNFATRQLGQLLADEGRPLPFRYSRTGFPTDPTSRQSRHVVSYRGHSYETSYTPGEDGQPHGIARDYGVVAWRKLTTSAGSGLRVPRWVVFTVGCHTFGTQAGLAALVSKECAGTISRVVEDAEFDFAVSIDHATAAREHRVQVLDGSHPEFAEGNDTFRNWMEVSGAGDFHCVGRLGTGIRRLLRLKFRRDVEPLVILCKKNLPGGRGPQEAVLVTLAGMRPVAAQSFDGASLGEGSMTWSTLKRNYRIYREDRDQRLQQRLARFTPRYYADGEWLLSYPPVLREYDGEWIAVRDKVVIAAAASEAELYTALGALDVDPHTVDPPYVQLYQDRSVTVAVLSEP